MVFKSFPNFILEYTFYTTFEVYSFLTAVDFIKSLAEKNVWSAQNIFRWSLKFFLIYPVYIILMRANLDPNKIPDLLCTAQAFWGTYLSE